MSIVKPFRALRPKPEYAKEVASPPYDVLNAKEAREIVKNSPNSFLRVNKAELEFDDNVDQYSEIVYQKGKDNLQRLIDENLMIRDESSCFYIYRITMSGKSQTGLVALTSVDEYDKGLIKKHEHTRPEKVNDRANHIEYLGAQVGPVFSTYRALPEVQQVFDKITAFTTPVDFVADDGVRHELWVVSSDYLIKEMIDAFDKLPHLYIADGHHRSQAASEVCKRVKENSCCSCGGVNEQFGYFLNVIFPDNELNILPYNRVVKDLNGLSTAQILEKAKQKFDIEPHNGNVDPKKLHTFGLYAEGKWYHLKAKDGSFNPNDPTGSIDADILGANFIDPILGISDPKTDKRINFVGGIRGTQELVKLVDSGEYKIAFSLYPTSIEQLLNVADAGEVMPPKSTWFEPKLRSGMVVNLLNN
ncbi:MAG: DUF1015 domain-containing protein [Candidatus Marinimicrobia bacterium]|nr:DUF1015 domain-containing protein [Candidatus Neomarinimicrobiota bacterium]MBL7023684.1 DUF1015 domain-containing protein [Candidatus Neomarinimicrobiota bacterium]MBL7110165.1 DUF1015 domain-containing protein [Candidatus Neomarinimicrobiota bacterium]